MILVLVLLGAALLINPANGYTKEYEGTYIYAPDHAWAGMPREFYVNSSEEFWNNVTKIEWSGYGYVDGASSNRTGSWNVTLKSTTIPDTPAMVTWAIGSPGYNQPMSISIEWDKPDLTGKSQGFTTVKCYQGLSNYCTGVVDNTYATPNYTSGAGGYTLNSEDNIIAWFMNGASSPNEPFQGSYILSGELNSAPVINDFTKDATCYAPGEAIVLESNVTGTVDSWLWEIYDSSDVSVWSSTDSIETIVDENFGPGLYQVQLYVENTAGSDFLSKDNWLNITQAGGCGPIGNWTNPFPTTTVTTIPTQQFYETMTMPPYIVTNMSGINEEINKGIFSNMSQGYRDYVDYVGEQANTTFTGTFRTLLSPVTLVVNAISYAIGLFSTSINSLTVYTTVPLAITAIVINYMPWQIVTLITAGIAIDAILIIILGR